MTAYLTRRLLLSLASLLASSLVLLALWYLAVNELNVSPYIAKGPADVWRYLFTDPAYGTTTAADHRATMLRQLAVTLEDAGAGFCCGILASVALAAAFRLFPPLEGMFLPLAMLMRTIPLVGFAPVIYIVLGGGTVTVALIGLILVFLPVVVNLTLGFRSAPRHALDLARVYGGGRWTTLRKVEFPHALPHLFAAVKIAVPASLVAAMLYEWLFSLQGLGGQITVANADSRYDETWTITVLVTAVSIVAHTFVQVIESPVLALWGPTAGSVRRKGR